uniref:Uncharacterized protein n=1 Tax=Leersia perrieri TaxID=77586 RepID=A0A0D9XEF4_9ORYZ
MESKDLGQAKARKLEEEDLGSYMLEVQGSGCSQRVTKMVVHLTKGMEMGKEMEMETEMDSEIKPRLNVVEPDCSGITVIPPGNLNSSTEDGWPKRDCVNDRNNRVTGNLKY